VREHARSFLPANPPPGSGRRPWSVVVRPISDPVLAARWPQLQALGAVESPFLRWEWLSGLAGDPELSARSRVLCVQTGDEVVGLLPLEVADGPGHLRVLGPPGWRWLGADHLDVVSVPTLRAAVAAVCVRHVRRMRGWDLLDLQGLADAGSLNAAAPACRSLSTVRLPYREVVCPYVELQGKGETELLASRNLRQQVRRGVRRAVQRGGGFEIVTDPERVTVLLADLMRLHNGRFGAASRVFATPARRAFHLSAAHRLASAQMARIYRLGADGRSSALLYAFVLGERVYYYALGFDPDEAGSPGLTLLGQAIVSAAEEGFTEFDLLRGEHGFKQRLATGARSDGRVLLLRVNPRSVRALPSLAQLAVDRARRAHH
jgi:CelD/BcsL family acetyltransferase involved in cellulose biosynthesis